MQKITSIMLNVTHCCNLKCRYCFVHQHPATMTLQTAMDATNWIIDNAKNIKVTPHINFFGGEPLLCYDTIIKPIVTYVRDELRIPFTFGMTTNGTLLTEERIDYLSKNHVGVLFSIDGVKDVQDANRITQEGTGSFDILEPLLPLIVQKFNPTFRMTTTPELCHRIFENILFAESKGFQRFFVAPNEFVDWSEEKIAILAEQMRLYADYYIDKYRKNETPIEFLSFD